MVGYAGVKRDGKQKKFLQYVISILTTRLRMKNKELIQEVYTKKYQNKTTD